MRLAAFVIGSIGILFAGPALAQTSRLVAPKSVVPPMSEIDVQDVQGRREMLFQCMLEKPDDLDAAFEYAALSVQAGDLEAAISTLERMLIFAPGLPRLQLELGVLYYRLSAFETARSYFEAAVSAPDVPAEVQRARSSSISPPSTMPARPTRFAGQVRAGIRYQTNANRAPTDGVVLLNGSPFMLDGVRARLARRQCLRRRRVPLFARSSLAGRHAGSRSGHLRLEAVPARRTRCRAGRTDGRSGLRPRAVRHRQRRDRQSTASPRACSRAAISIRPASAPAPASSCSPSPGSPGRPRSNTGTRTITTATPRRPPDLRNGDEIRAYTYRELCRQPDAGADGNAYVQTIWAEADYLAYTEGGFSVGPRIPSPRRSARASPWIVSLNAGLRVPQLRRSRTRSISLTEAEQRPGSCSSAAG